MARSDHPFYRRGEEGSEKNGDSHAQSQQVTTGQEGGCSVETQVTTAKCITTYSQVRAIHQDFIFLMILKCSDPLRSIVEKSNSLTGLPRTSLDETEWNTKAARS